MLIIKSGTTASTVLSEYERVLMARVAEGNLGNCSVRLALCPAVVLLILSADQGRDLSEQAALDCYLINAPGQKAAITGFVLFLNKKYSKNLMIRLDEQRARESRKSRLEKNLIGLLSASTLDEAFKKNWFSISLASFHGLPHSVVRQLESEGIASQDSEGFSITWRGKAYWIPH